MKIFMWERVSDCGSGCYHSGGGAVVIAASLEDARNLGKTKGADLSSSPDFIAELLEDEVESITIFPDAGCC